ncbi:MAG: surface-adhesin E family protein [Pseudomonadota bacterium]
MKPVPRLLFLRGFLAVWLLAGAAAAVQAQTAWFTVMGDASDPTATTIEVDPIPVAVNGDQRTMRVRVNRTLQRTTRDGVNFRSFRSHVLFDCSNKTARYISVDFYMQPLWKGESHKTVDYPATDLRPMEFREVEPNPRDRIIRAACRTN